MFVKSQERLMRISPSAFFAAGLAVAVGIAAPAAATRLEVQGTEFVLTAVDGEALRGDGLVGTLFTLRTERGDQPIRIDGYDSQSTVRGAVALYRFSVPEPESGAWVPLCAADVLGRRLGFPIQDEDGSFSVTCTSGAEGKCILLGYWPWEGRPGGIPMRDLYRACIHLIRADYGGDDRPTTRDGTMIDVYDRFGIHSPSHLSSRSDAAAAQGDAGQAAAVMTFEAAWAPDGAVCVAHPRIARNASLADLARRYAGLRDRVGPTACTEAAMAGEPRAILFNRSRATAAAP
jgi:hypothetical protein